MNKKSLFLFGLVCLMVILLNVLTSYKYVTEFFDTLKIRRAELQKVYNYVNYLSNLKDAETGQRGFVITGNEAYLAPYQQAISFFGLDETKHFLKSEEESSNPEIANQAKKIKQLQLEKINELEEVIEKRKHLGFDDARYEIEGNSGKLIMDELRNLINTVIRNKQGELELLDKHIKDTTNKTLLILVGGNSIAFFLIGLSLFSIYRSIKKVQEKDRQLSLTLKSLNESLVMREAILNSTNYAIISVDQSGIITSFNPAAEKMLGYSKEEMIGRCTPEIFHDEKEIEDRAITLSKQLKKKILPSFEVFTFFARDCISDVNEWTYIRKDGSRLPVSLSITAVKNQEGQITGYVGVAYDMTERREIDRLKNELIAIVSHELRSPVVSIKGTLDLLSQKEFNLSEQAKKIVTLGQKNCNRLILLTDDLLDIQQMEAGKVKFNFKKLNVSEFLSNVVQSNNFSVQKFSLKFVCSQVPPEWNVEADEDRLMQVMNNLITNAIKYSPIGGTIEIDAKKIDSKIHFDVKDQGPGIPKEIQSRIFQKFVHDTSSANKGKNEAGLGLTIAKSIVENHKGTINFKTSPQGTIFWFELPLLKE